MDGHIIKQQHEWFPILQLALWQNDTIDYTWLIHVHKYQLQSSQSAHTFTKAAHSSKIVNFNIKKSAPGSASNTHSERQLREYLNTVLEY